MSPLEAVALGILQGLTEFLPVSSSGHLVLAQSALGIRLPGMLFEVTVHVGTLLAVLWIYRTRIFELLRGLAANDRDARRYVLLLLLASIPAGVVGLAGRSLFERIFERPLVAASLLLVSGVFAWTLSRTTARAGDPRPGFGQAAWIGAAQALAILPGLSRSGATVAAGAWRGVEVVRAAEFSFLLSVPAIAGAAILAVPDLGATAGQVGTLPLVLGFVAAGVSGIAAIRIFVRMLKRKTFHRFAYYCWAVGLGYLAASVFVPTLRGPIGG